MKFIEVGNAIIRADQIVGICEIRTQALSSESVTRLYLHGGGHIDVMGCSVDVAVCINSQAPLGLPEVCTAH